MADFPPPLSNGMPAAGRTAPVTSGVLAYLLFAIAAIGGVVSSGLVAFAPLVGLAGIAGVVIAYVVRGDARGTWVASHLAWLIRTFWWSLAWALVGGLLAITIIGIPIALLLFAIVSVWGIYRVIRGYLWFKDSRPIGG